MSQGFPVRPEDFRKDWLEQVFAAPSGSLRDISFAPVGTGQVCDSYRFTCDWSEPGPPATFIAKCPSHDETSRGAAAIFHLYDTEVGWYRDFAADCPVNCPPCYHADVSGDEKEFALLLADMAPAGQGDQLAGCTMPQIRSAVREAARLHSFRPKGVALSDVPWLNHGADNGDFVLKTLPASYAAFRERYVGRLSEDILNMGDALIDRLDAYMGNAPAHDCIVHADFRLDNILFSPDGHQAIPVDWQTCQHGLGASDLAYLIGTSFADPAERRAQEGALIDLYIAEMAAHGAVVDRAVLWDQYRRSAFAGFVMAINASMFVERTARGDEMFAVMAERPAQMALELDSLSLI